MAKDIQGTKDLGLLIRSCFKGQPWITKTEDSFSSSHGGWGKGDSIYKILRAASTMAQRTKVLAAKSDALCLISEFHMVEG